MRRFWPVFAVALITEATACSAIWGFEDGTLGNAEAGVEADAPASSSGTVPTDGSAVDAEPEAGPPPPGCTERKIDPFGYFVTPAGEDVALCGTSNTPCKTLNFLLQEIRTGGGAPHVFLGRGVYAEHVELTADLVAKGLSFEGEWEVRLDGANRQWLPLCTDVQNGRTFLVGSESKPVVLVAGAAGDDAGTTPDAGASTLSFSYLQIRSRGIEVPGYVDGDGTPIVSPAGPGESLAGLHVVGASVSLSNSSIAVARGGDGVSGAPGNGSPAGIECDSGGDSGAAGAPGTDAPATSCSIAAAGFVCTEPTPATPGSRGRDNSGCGVDTCGQGGRAGQPGTPGGAAVAMFVGSRGAARVDGSILATGGGGTGGSGGAGAGGGAGGGVIVCKGGDGGRGGYGSPAPGGASFCIAKLPESTVEYLDGNTCARGDGGAGGTSALPAPAVPIAANAGPSGDVGP